MACLALSHPFLHPSLSARNRAQCRSVMATTDRRCPGAGRARPGLFLPGAGRALTLAPGDLVTVPLGPPEYTGVVWGEGNPRPGLRQPPQGHRGQARHPAAQSRAARFRRLGAELHARCARHGAAHGLRMGEHLGPERERVGVRLAGPAAAAHDAGARARAARCSQTAWRARRARPRRRPASRPA